MNTLYSRGAARAFTLIEILIVVVILGILASIVIIGIRAANEEAQNTVFGSNVKAFAIACERFWLDTGAYPEDASSGVLPTGFDDYVIEANWTGGTPLGGVWDTELNSMGITSAVGVHFNGGDDPGAVVMTEVDLVIDDGDLATGAFRELAVDRYYWVVAE